MSELDYAMMKHIEHIVNEVHRPFSYRDFSHMMRHGTFRNKISKLVKKGIVEVDYWSTTAFYTLKGKKFGKPVTSLPCGGLYTPHFPSYKSRNLYALINDLPISKNSLHDIRLSFKVWKIWSILSKNSFQINSRNKDLRLPGINLDDLFVGITVHRSDTVTVTIACSYTPIVIDMAGVIRLSNAMTRVEERLSRYLDDAGAIACIPTHMKWLVKMWHFGADGRTEYGGDLFSITYAEAEGILVRVYSKRMKDGKVRPRLERQEYPNKDLAKAIEDKLHANTNSI